jgi:hypothetical protein
MYTYLITEVRPSVDVPFYVQSIETVDYIVAKFVNSGVMQRGDVIQVDDLTSTQLCSFTTEEEWHKFNLDPVVLYQYIIERDIYNVINNIDRTREVQ